MLAATRGPKARGGMVLSLILGITLVAACSGSSATGGPSGTPPSGGGASTAPTEAPTAAATEAETAPPTESSATAVPTAIDPCTIVTQDEASTLAGESFGPGEESETSGHAKICTYGSQTLDVLTVDVAVAPDTATLQADEAAGLAALQKAAGKGLSTTPVTGVGDNAEFVSASQTVSGGTIRVEGLYVVQGLNFLAITDVTVNKALPTSADLQAQATTSLARFP